MTPADLVLLVGAGFAADFHTQCYAHVNGIRAEVVAVTSQHVGQHLRSRATVARDDLAQAFERTCHDEGVGRTHHLERDRERLGRKARQGVDHRATHGW